MPVYSGDKVWGQLNRGDDVLTNVYLGPRGGKPASGDAILIPRQCMISD